MKSPFGTRGARFNWLKPVTYPLLLGYLAILGINLVLGAIVGDALDNHDRQ